MFKYNLAIGIDEIEQKSQSFLSKLDNYVSSLDDESFEGSEDEKSPAENSPVKNLARTEESECETSEDTDEFEESD